jgi:N-acetylmuramoyl-L-alanine amidase
MRPALLGRLALSTGALLFALIALAMSPPAARAESSATFSGETLVPNAVTSLSQAGILRGRDTSPLAPHQYVRRGQLALYLARVLRLDEAGSTRFTDLTVSDPSFGAVGALYEAGLVTGTTPTTFSPDEDVTRQDAVSWIMESLDYQVRRQETRARIMSSLGLAVEDDKTPVVRLSLPEQESADGWLGGFRDRALIDPARAEAVANGYRLGIVDGTADGWFCPTLPLSWGDMVVMLQRAFIVPFSARLGYPNPVLAATSLPSLAETSEGPLVWYIEDRLAYLKYRPGSVDGVYDDRTRDAVLAFQKVEGLGRDGVAGGEFWTRIVAAATPMPRNTFAGTRVEIDLTRQVLFMITDNEVWKIVHCSTGSSGRRTRTGHFQIGDKFKGWVSCVTLSGRMYFPSYVVSKTAIHGYRQVPPYPASHGCIRVPVWMAEEIFYETPRGTTVDIYR